MIHKGRGLKKDLREEEWGLMILDRKAGDFEPEKKVSFDPLNNN